MAGSKDGDNKLNRAGTLGDANADARLHQPDANNGCRKVSLQTWWNGQMCTAAGHLMGRQQPEAGDGLDGATDDLGSFKTRQADVEAGSARIDPHTHAQMILNQLNPRHLARRRHTKGTQPSASTDLPTPDGSAISTAVDGSILSLLLRSYANNSASESTLSLTHGDDDTTGSDTDMAQMSAPTTGNKRNVKWYKSEQHLAERASTSPR
jgi:hypothetical protein